MNRKDGIEKHYQRTWGVAPLLQPFLRGPTHRLPPDFSVIKLQPIGLRSDWVYATSCMSQPAEARSIELHFRCQIEDDSIVELLYAIAHFHCTDKKLDVGHTVNFGRPWTSGSKCDHGLVSRPYLDGPEFELLQTDGEQIQFFWIIPIFQSEVEYKMKYGLEALEQRFDQVVLPYFDPVRKSVV